MRRREQYARRKLRQDGGETRGRSEEKAKRRNGSAADSRESSGRRATSRLTGRFSVQRSGVGFVLPDSGRGGDIFVHVSNFGEAWHGDRVEVTLLPRRGRNREGVITAVLKRGRETITAEIMRGYGKNRWLARPLDSRLDFAFLAALPKESESAPGYDAGPPSPDKPGKGNIVLLKPGDPLERGLWAAEILKNFGPGDDLDAQERIVKASHGIPTFFPDDALAEAETLHQSGHLELDNLDYLLASGQRRDLRHIPFVTIDGETARDFDDAIYVEERPRGFTLWVGIADVSHYVRPLTPLDREALARGNSYYFPQSVEPMLPEALSNDLCSLKPDVPRLAMVAEMPFDRDGKPAGAPQFSAAVIQSRARLTYTWVFNEVIEDRGGKPQGDNPLEVSLPGPHPSLTLVGGAGGDGGENGILCQGCHVESARETTGNLQYSDPSVEETHLGLSSDDAQSPQPPHTGQSGFRRGEFSWPPGRRPPRSGKIRKPRFSDFSLESPPGRRGERYAIKGREPQGAQFLGVPSPSAMLKSAEKLARLMHGVRQEAGGLDFELPEPEIRVDAADGNLSIVREERNFAHQLIEMFMVAANEAVAGFLAMRGGLVPYRTHPSPDPDKLLGLFELLGRTGLARPDKYMGRGAAQGASRGAAFVSPAALPDILAGARGTDAEFVVARLVLRTMMQARYSLDNEGHFGLASACYCHFTSPIRRYADLLAHRALKHALGLEGFGPLPGRERLTDMLDIVNADEQTSKEAEREMLRRMTVLLLRERVGEVFDGVISGVTDFGIFVELGEVMAEGMISLSALSDDYYDYFPERQELLGRGTRQRFYLGRAMKVRLVEANLRLLEINLEPVAEKGAGRRARSKGVGEWIESPLNR